MASRRLSIVGLADGQQPMSNEDRSVHVVFNGEQFGHGEKHAELQGEGHVLTTRCSTEIIPHLQEGHCGENVTLHECTCWKMDFPDTGQEVDGEAKALVDESAASNFIFV